MFVIHGEDRGATARRKLLRGHGLLPRGAQQTCNTESFVVPTTPDFSLFQNAYYSTTYRSSHKDPCGGAELSAESSSQRPGSRRRWAQNFPQNWKGPQRTRASGDRARKHSHRTPSSPGRAPSMNSNFCTALGWHLSAPAHARRPALNGMQIATVQKVDQD